MSRRWVIGVLFVWTGCSGAASNPAGPTDTQPAVLIGAGDIGVCGSNGAALTGALLDRLPGTVFGAGDFAYPNGTEQQFRECYDPHWGRQKHRTRPAPGNHEYGSPAAAPYFAYFGASAGLSGLGYYHYRKADWEVFALNSNPEAPSPASQIAWLAAQLGGEPSACAIAYFHHPRFSSGVHGLTPPPDIVRDFWRELYAAGADIVISAHEHFYERFAPQDPEGRLDQRYGIRQFIVGTGGATLAQPVRRLAQVEASHSAYGVLRLTLEPESYRWEFVAAESGGVLDSGTGACHGRP